LNKQDGLSHGKVTRCLESLFGIRLSRGGSVHTVLRSAVRCEPVYEAIRQTVAQSDWVVPDETGWRVGGYPAWLHTLVSPQATAYVIDPTRSGAVAEDILGLDYDGTMIHDGWSPYDQFENALHQQCLNHLVRRADNMAATATRGAVRFPRRVAELLRAGLDLRDRHAAGEISRQGLAVARGRLENRLSDLIFPPKINAAIERLAQHLWAHRDDLFTFLRQPGLDATNWRAELAIRFGVILRKVWGGSRTWAGARAQAILMSVWRTCWQQGSSALDFLSRLLRGPPSQACATTGLNVWQTYAAVTPQFRNRSRVEGDTRTGHAGIGGGRSGTMLTLEGAECGRQRLRDGVRLTVIHLTHSQSAAGRGEFRTYFSRLHRQDSVGANRFGGLGGWKGTDIAAPFWRAYRRPKGAGNY
jgi:hypothetical protein